MICEICGKDILKDSQCIDYKYYHNDCIINLTKENKELKKQLQKENQKLEDNWNKLRETLKNEQLGSILYSDRTRFANIDEILNKMQELEKSDSNE